MKKACASIVLFLCVGGVIACAVLLCAFFLSMGTTYETSVSQYGAWKDDLEDVPSFLPESIEGYTVNAYSYTLYSYMDTCYEIFLDITVEETEFDRLLQEAKTYPNSYVERSADYCDGYTEIVFMDVYEKYQTDDPDDLEQVGWADIEKVIYNPHTSSIVYVVFHANDTGVYDVADVAYFNRFSINADDYFQKVSRLENKTSQFADASTIACNIESVRQCSP